MGLSARREESPNTAPKRLTSNEFIGLGAGRRTLAPIMVLRMNMQNGLRSYDFHRRGGVLESSKKRTEFEIIVRLMNKYEPGLECQKILFAFI